MEIIVINIRKNYIEFSQIKKKLERNENKNAFNFKYLKSFLGYNKKEIVPQTFIKINKRN